MDTILDPFEDHTDEEDEELYEDEPGLVGDQDDDGAITLDALEAEEIETVESNESATIIVDEVSEIKAIRREEMTFDFAAQSRRGDEFVCRSCFLLLKNVQLADRHNMLCVDCV